LSEFHYFSDFPSFYPPPSVHVSPCWCLETDYLIM